VRARSRRLALAAAAALAALVALAGYGLWRERLRLAEALVGRSLAAAGVVGARFAVVEVGAGSARLEGLRVGEPPDLAVATVELDYSLASLRRGLAENLRLAGVRVRGRIGEDGVSFGALDALAGAGPGAEPGLPLPPVEHVSLRDARLELTTPAGPIAVGVAGDGSLAGGGATAELALTASGAMGEAELALSLRAAPDGWSASWRDGRARLVSSALGGVELGPLRGEAGAAGSGPVAIELGVGLAGGRAELAGKGALALDPVRATLDLGGTLALAPGTLEPADLAPGLGRFLRRAEGQLRIDARLALERGRLAYTLRAGTESLDLETPDGTAVKGLAGRAELAGPPLRTAGSQTVRFRTANLLGAFEDGEVRWQLGGDTLEVEEARWSYAGGRLSTAGRFALGAARWPFTVSVSQLPLERLLAELSVPELSATGTLSGELPLVYDGEALRVDGGVLRAEPPGGVIRYAPAGSAAGSLGVGGDLEVLVGALEDLHYSKLVLELEGGLSGDVEAHLSIDGRNPHYQGGRPVELRVNVETNLPALLRGSRSITGVPEVIERRLRDRVPSSEE
jgi:Dicarboxylate transport